MATRLPYQATTATGERFDISFPLHPNTGSPVRVSQMISAILEALDREVKLEATSNGDVLQALAMATAIRASMVEAPKRITDQMTAELVGASLRAMNDAKREYRQVGHA